MTDEISKYMENVLANIKKLTSNTDDTLSILDPLHIVTWQELRELRDGVRFCNMEKTVSNAVSLKGHLDTYSELGAKYNLTDEHAIAAEEISYAGNQIIELLTEEAKSCICKRKENPLKEAGTCTKCLKK